MRKINCVFALLLAIMLLLSACADGAGASTSVYTAATPGTRATRKTAARTTVQTTASTANPYQREYDDVTLFGESFTFVLPTDYGCEKYRGIYAEENADVRLEWEYYWAEKIKLYIEECHDGKINTVNMSLEALENELLTGNDSLDFVIAPYGTVDKSYCRNVYDMGIDMSKPWWSGKVIDDLAANGEAYAMLSYFMIDSLDSLKAVFFSKDVKEASSWVDYDFYDLVYENEWTLDKLYEISKRAASEGASYGLACDRESISSLYIGAGQNYVNKTESENGSDIFSHGFGSAAALATEKIINIFSDGSTAIFSADEAKEKFKEGKILFTVGRLGDIPEYGKEKINYGVLPMPKAEANEDDYRSCFEAEPLMLYSLKNSKDPRLVGDFLWIYSYYSYYNLYKNFLSLYKYSYTTDSDASCMVDMILKVIRADVAYYGNWLDINEQYISAVLAGENPIERFGTELGGELEALAGGSAVNNPAAS